MCADWVTDPYSDFLDLPPGERPPHYYQLLELEIFCAQRERIEHAVRKQFRKIKPYQEHPDRKLRETIQDVMTRIARARVVLSDPAQKEAYDAELAERLGIDRQGVLASRLATPVPEYAVTIVAGPTDVGETVELLTDVAVTIGRDPHCVIPLSSQRVGTLHGELRYRDRRWLYAHVDPRRLTVLGDQRVSRRELQVDDRLEIGGYALRFHRLAGAHKAVDPHPPLTLIVTRGPSVLDAIFSVLAPETVVIGAVETALWQLAGPGVAARHCRIVFENESWAALDLESAAGTLINGRKIARHPLADRDVLTLGDFEIMARLRQ